MVKLTAAHSQLFFANYKEMKKKSRAKNKGRDTQNLAKRIEASMEETKREVKDKQASHKSNPSSVPQGCVDSYSTLPCVTCEAVTCVKVVP
jgi:hypothetical protein